MYGDMQAFDFSSEAIRIGTLVKGSPSTTEVADYVRKIVPYGFESVQVVFSRSLFDCDLERLAGDVRDVLGGSGAIVSAVGIYGNTLENDDEGVATRCGMEMLIDAAHLFGTNTVCGFTGRLRGGVAIDHADSMGRFREVFGPMAARASDKGVRIGFENCPMGGNWHSGDWNMAHNPAAWELLFNEVPSDALGLEWEPCHQMCQLIDPMPQLRKWVPKIFHVHGKDATVRQDLLREVGAYGRDWFAWHRHPGFGDSNWTDVISDLRLGGYTGSIDVEGWHDPVYKDDLEMTGQVGALNHLKRCRGGDADGRFVPNPRV
jgi:sugar phosphate isomerase/epimerase